MDTLHSISHTHNYPQAYLPPDTHSASSSSSSRRRSGGSKGDGQFHLYEFVHTGEELIFLYDSEVFYVLSLNGRIALDAFFEKQFFVLLNVAVGGWWPGWDVDYDALPAEMEVDYVRVYELK